MNYFKTPSFVEAKLSDEQKTIKRELLESILIVLKSALQLVQSIKTF